ncbi:GAF domain-containing protein [Pseudoalteromonas peptidolytica]|uniref:GAF domain-containing protein n=1 Tax=Pseudoalteromonas peptidolytica F12-50-A1 TaxID=1315280 RepID=A0A8I0T5V3_9GAMM|nr:GAF domain-containing protein [Pseudoalteromonas peptidolytica]MBE0348420.1 hypothetical protein [Pseudoalteromonas peptidolytica F12-50-A1]NLR15017.1 GAF domain-containing protein [Pseudoalteromonas peptidolytica]GEK09629.1 hypothetical protein PPE03_18780 [Pseudoalteromonas peptidolytica]
MKTPQKPDNEQERVAALKDLVILDTEPEESLDRVTRFTAHIFDVPIALISLVDTDRQWFKSRFGLDARETERDISFCGHAILEDTIFVVHNALEDPRFCDNLLVQGDPHIRFYAGAPLKLSSGFTIGTICIIDVEPREFTQADCGILQQLAQDIVTAIQNK